MKELVGHGCRTTYFEGDGKISLFDPFLLFSTRYIDVIGHIEVRHISEKSSLIQICKRCVPEQIFTSFEDLLRHTRSYHRKKPDVFIESSRKKISDTNGKTLCENCGKTVLATMIAR